MYPTNIFKDNLGFIHIHGNGKYVAQNSEPYYLKYSSQGNLLQSDYYTIQTENHGLDLKLNPNGLGFFMFVNTLFGHVIVFLDNEMNPYHCKSYDQQINLYSTWLTRLKSEMNTFVVNSDYNGSISFDLSLINHDICPSTLNFTPLKKSDSTLLEPSFHLFNQFTSNSLEPSVGLGVHWELIDIARLQILDFCYNKDVLNLQKFENNEPLLSPNPCSDKVTISNIDISDLNAIFIYNQLGQLVNKEKYLLESNIIILEGLESGIYFIAIHTNAGVKNKRLIVAQ